EGADESREDALVRGEAPGETPTETPVEAAIFELDAGPISGDSVTGATVAAEATEPEPEREPDDEPGTRGTIFGSFGAPAAEPMGWPDVGQRDANVPNLWTAEPPADATPEAAPPIRNAIEPAVERGKPFGWGLSAPSDAAGSSIFGDFGSGGATDSRRPADAPSEAPSRIADFFTRGAAEDVTGAQHERATTRLGDDVAEPSP